MYAALKTGDPGAYLATELAWRRNWIADPPDGFQPFEGFLLGARFWAGQWHIPEFAGYLVYLLAVFFPQSSIFRLLVPISPLWGAVAMPRSRVWRFGVLAACLVGQWVWIYTMYALAGTAFWTIP